MCGCWLKQRIDAATSTKTRLWDGVGGNDHPVARGRMGWYPHPLRGELRDMSTSARCGFAVSFPGFAPGGRYTPYGEQALFTAMSIALLSRYTCQPSLRYLSKMTIRGCSPR